MEGLGEAVRAIWAIMIVGLVFLPLGVWKAIEIIIWLCHHIHFS